VAQNGNKIPVFQGEEAAKYGGNKDASELDAAFEFFEVRAPAVPRPNDPGGKH